MYKRDGNQVNLITNDDIYQASYSDILTLEQNFKAVSQNVIKIHNFYDVYLEIMKISGYFSIQDEKIFTFKKPLKSNSVIYGCFDSDSQWYVSEAGYIAVQNETFHKSVRSGTYNYTKIHFSVLYD